MLLTLRLDPSRLRRWHVRLVERLSRRSNVALQMQWADAADTKESAITVALLFALERLIHGVPDDDLTAKADASEFAPYLANAQAQADLVLDFSSGIPRKEERTWKITFDGYAGEDAALSALKQGRPPLVRIVEASSGAEVVSGRPGTESGGILVLAFHDLLARTMTLVTAALDGAGTRQDGAAAYAAPVSTPSLGRFAVRSLTRALVSSLYRLCYNAPHWRVGWRYVDGADVIDLRDHPSGGWRELPDDRHRFYADPFPVVKDGRTLLFVEDFAHWLGYGVISTVEFNGVGPLGVPRPVLDTGSHLSYPFVFEHGGEMWMVPESSSAGTIDLYRCAPFPDRWVKEATLVSGVVASDAMLFVHEGRWWMLATVRDGGGAFSDALYVWFAADLRGPWRPHARNPLLVDIATARPAGRVVRRNGKLIRPFQDCSRGYGAALGLAEITRLDEDGFTQRVETILRPGPLWPGRRLHTLNRAGRLECIDGSAIARRF